MKKIFAEFTGTFALVFCGTGSVIVNEQTGGVLGNTGIAITFGLIILVMIYSYGRLSGAHFNPAVTAAFSIAGLFKRREVLPYISAQLAGALAASITLHFLFPGNNNLGATHPSGTEMQSFIFECILTYFLMTVILHVSQGSKEQGIIAGLAIGFTVMLEAMFAGPVSGASMNPARSLAPAIISGRMSGLWIYLLAPPAGAAAAVLSWKITRH